MIKFAYIVILIISSSLLFVFSKHKEVKECSHEETGQLIFEDSTSTKFVVLTSNNQTLIPLSLAENVILTASDNVAVCYKIVSTENENILVQIEKVTYLKETSKSH